MPFEMEREQPSGVTAQERVYVDAEGNLVGEDDPKRVSLVAAPGTAVPAEYAGKYQEMTAARNPANEPQSAAATTPAAPKPDPGAAPAGKK